MRKVPSMKKDFSNVRMFKVYSSCRRQFNCQI
jgi:hypothetical protein